MLLKEYQLEGFNSKCQPGAFKFRLTTGFNKEGRPRLSGSGPY